MLSFALRELFPRIASKRRETNRWRSVQTWFQLLRTRKEQRAGPQSLCRVGVCQATLQMETPSGWTRSNLGRCSALHGVPSPSLRGEPCVTRPINRRTRCHLGKGKLLSFSAAGVFSGVSCSLGASYGSKLTETPWLRLPGSFPRRDIPVIYLLSASFSFRTLKSATTESGARSELCTRG